jgi:hypothetical protein
MAAEIAVQVDERIMKYLEAKSDQSHQDRAEVLSALIDEWYESMILQLHQQYLRGDLTLRGMARQLGLTYRELYQAIEDRELSF